MSLTKDLTEHAEAPHKWIVVLKRLLCRHDWQMEHHYDEGMGAPFEASSWYEIAPSAVACTKCGKEPPVSRGTFSMDNFTEHAETEAKKRFQKMKT